MKRVTYLFAILCMASTLWAQDLQLSITALQPEYEHIPEEARQQLESRLEQILTNNGVTSGLSDRFVISAKVNITQRDIAPTNPPKVSEKMEVTITIGDAIDNRVFGKTTITVAGIGVSETKAQIQAYQRISPQNAQIQTLVSNAKTQIMNYYTNHCADILTIADHRAQMGERKEAIASLLAVPQECHDCYTQAQDKAFALYQVTIDDEAQGYLKQAQAAWSLKHNYAQAAKAYEYLLKVNPHSNAVAQADALSKNIEQSLRTQEAEQRTHAKEVEEREWNMKVQQYNDNVALRKQRIDMFKEIGVAIGNHLPDAITQVVKRW
jgi:hypothetical protein